MDIDTKKDLVTVKGTMDAKTLAQNLKEKLKRQVEIVPPKKEKEGGGEVGEKKDGNGGGGGKKKGGGGDAGQEENAAGIAKVEGIQGNRMDQFMVQHPGYGFGYGYGNFYGHGYQGYGQPGPYGPYGQPGYGHGSMVGEHLHAQHLHAPQMFSDENPNACSVM